MLVTDDRGEPVRLSRLPSRVVSLVPSDTYTLLRLGIGERLVGRTRYCVEPAPEVAAIAEVGGTKDPDLERVLALDPDLVIMNREENTRRAWEALVDRRVAVLTTCPRRMSEGAAQVARLARLVGDLSAEAKERVREAYGWLRRLAQPREEPALAAFVPIWMDPLMTIHGDTFLSDALDLAGLQNVFADRERRYPLAADLGRAPAAPPAKVGERDTRYPRVTLDEVVARAPEVVLLPDEPHAFDDRDAAVFRALDIPAARSGRVVPCSGRDLSWPGAQALDGLPRLRALASALREASR